MFPGKSTVYRFLICPDLNLLHLKVPCAKFGWNFDQVALEKKFLIVINIFSLVPKVNGASAALWTNFNAIYPRSCFAKR